MQAESASSELQEGLPLRNKYTNNKAKLFNINTIKQTAFEPYLIINLLRENLRTLSASRLVTNRANHYFLP